MTQNNKFGIGQLVRFQKGVYKIHSIENEGYNLTFLGSDQAEIGEVDPKFLEPIFISLEAMIEKLKKANRSIRFGFWSRTGEYIEKLRSLYEVESYQTHNEQNPSYGILEIFETEDSMFINLGAEDVEFDKYVEFKKYIKTVLDENCTFISGDSSEFADMFIDFIKNPFKLD